MPLDTSHPQATSQEQVYLKIRDVIGGEDIVKAASQRYLPMLSGQNTTEYDGYLQRASFHEATGRTVSGLAGAIFRKPPSVDWPNEEMEARAEAISHDATPFDSFAKHVTTEVIKLGRHGVLVDAPAVEDGGEPFLVSYSGESIINWQTAVVDGRQALVKVVLKESTREPKTTDEYEGQDVERFRVLRLARGPEGLVYFVQVFRKESDDKGAVSFVLETSVIPTSRGKSFDFIPFTFFGPTTLLPAMEQSPILGLVNMNLSHYRSSADIEHGAHFTALPTIVLIGELAGSGDETAGAKIKIGPGAAIHLKGDGADAKMLEYTGQGLEALEKRLERKEAHMAVLGARLLEDQKSGVEAAETVTLRHRGENSMLASISDTVGRGLSQSLTWMGRWMGVDKPVPVDLNKDFFGQPMGEQGMVQLVAAWQSGGIGLEALYHNLREGERIPADWTFEDYQKDINDNGPTILGGEDDFEDPDPEGDE